MIKRAFIPPYHPANCSTLRAKRRRRDFYFFIKSEIVRLDDEGALTVLTGFCFALHITCQSPLWITQTGERWSAWFLWEFSYAQPE